MGGEPAKELIMDDKAIVDEYFKAQSELATLCQTLGDALSESIGLNYAAACGVSCCG
jgi:hypothetical protein